MSFEIEGVLTKKFEIESKTSSFQAREFVIEISSGNYPQFIKFQLTQDRCAFIDNYEEGERMKVFFDLRGREWNGKYFTNLNAWKIEKPNMQETSKSNGSTSNFQETSSFPTADDEPSAGFEDDLPF